jgi:hypothetical protein
MSCRSRSCVHYRGSVLVPSLTLKVVRCRLAKSVSQSCARTARPFTHHRSASINRCWQRIVKRHFACCFLLCSQSENSGS